MFEVVDASKKTEQMFSREPIGPPITDEVA
jgi:hypothetical protein